MAIYQPKFVLPDVRSGIGLGTIDATQDMVVSWIINGSSALDSFEIVICDNDTASTQLYTTGQITSGCPAYGTASNGATVPFSYTIPAANLSTANITNGNEYKLIITQWWSVNDSVTQSSASVFITRATPTLTISTIGVGGVISTRYYTFTGNYSQAQGDVLNFFRWQIAYADDTANPIFDTGNISGTMNLSCYFDGFFADTNYAIQLTVQTENGIEASTGWEPFSCAYTAASVSGDVTANCVGGTDAVLVEWTGIGYIPATAVGPYSISDDYILSLPADSTITWNEVSLAPMSFSEPWCVLWKGKLTAADATIFTIGQSDNDVVLGFSSKTIALRKGTTGLTTQSGIINSPTVTALLTPTNLYLRVEYLSGGLYPKTSLYPSDTLYPIDDATPTVDIYTKSVSYTQRPITSVTIGGLQECEYIEVTNGVVSQEVIDAAITNGTYTEGLNTNDYMLANWTQGLNAGTVNVGGETLAGFSLYRRQGDKTVLSKIADTDVGTLKIYDYGATTGQGPYTYYLFPIGTSTYITEALTTQAVMPCWWNWTLMECAETGEENIYNVLAAYRFRLNIETGPSTNSNTPSVLANFTRYPTVQLAPQNYKAGTLTGLIGAVDWSTGQPRYKDTIQLQDAIYALSTTHNSLFIKNRKGELLRIRISGPISMQTGDATRPQALTMTLPWVEIGRADNVSLYSTEYVGVQEAEKECSTHIYEGEC